VPAEINHANVEENPRFQLGKTLTLSCEAEGDPPPTITWFVNGTRVEESVLRSRVIVGDEGRSIKVCFLSSAVIIEEYHSGYQLHPRGQRNVQVRGVK